MRVRLFSGKEVAFVSGEENLVTEVLKILLPHVTYASHSWSQDIQALKFTPANTTMQTMQ